MTRRRTRPKALATLWALAQRGELDPEQRGASLNALVDTLDIDRDEASRRLYDAHQALQKVVAAMLLAQTVAHRPNPHLGFPS